MWHPLETGPGRRPRYGGGASAFRKDCCEVHKKGQGVAQALAPGLRIAKGRGALRDP